MKYSHLISARRVYENGENVAQYLRNFEQPGSNTQAAIEIAYDMQAGTYTDAALRDQAYWHRYTGELASLLGASIELGDSVMEVGCGECTTFTGIFRQLARGAAFYCFDISWSRVERGRQFVARFLDPVLAARLQLFVADISYIPLADKSVDVVYTAHSLEPNGGREVELMRELFRVARKKVVLFEPHFERASTEAQQRMLSHGYVRGLEQAIADSGGCLQRVVPVENVSNPLNPTFMLDISLPAEQKNAGSVWMCPITGSSLVRQGNVFWSQEAGLVYPVVGDIPVLRADAAILATAFGISP